MCVFVGRWVCVCVYFRLFPCWRHMVLCFWQLPRFPFLKSLYITSKDEILEKRMILWLWNIKNELICTGIGYNFQSINDVKILKISRSLYSKFFHIEPCHWHRSSAAQTNYSYCCSRWNLFLTWEIKFCENSLPRCIVQTQIRCCQANSLQRLCI